MSSEICYISSNCNQTPTAADWGKNNLICYGSCNCVFVYDPNLGGGFVKQTLTSHSKRVNSVRWLRGKDIDCESELISGSTDGTVIIWSLKDKQFTPFICKGHESNVNIVDGIYRKSNKHGALIVSVSMDCTLKIWSRNNPSDGFTLAQTITLGYHIGVALKVGFLPNDEVILACGLDNSKIQVYISDGDINFLPSGLISGHEDWVRSIDFILDGTDLLVASCSQDTFIRLWRITTHKITEKADLQEYNNKLIIKSEKQTYFIYLESVLAGHEGWIYSVNWSSKQLQLLSASIDKSMIIWEFNKDSNLWLEKIRVGEVGGNTLGFYGGMFDPTGQRILAYSYHGAFHIWTVNEGGGWVPCVTVGGHFDEVVDISWEPNGEFLYSVSADQTTRIHAPWSSNNSQVTWHEIARPQVHGYDLSSLAVISRYKFASGAEEKVIRTFEAPRMFVDNFKRLCKVYDGEGETVNYTQFTPKGASVPSLGLSNKAVYTDDNIDDTAPADRKNPYPEESHFTTQTLYEPPTEETLLQNTLWPEVQKLYGHGYEVFSLAASPDENYLASACKSTKSEHAAILLWDTSSWQQIQKLLSHTLTVVQMQFSPDSQHLLSVSRDRRWSIFSKDCSSGLFNLVATTDKKTSIHTRIIWTCSWSHDSKYFATGSRDGKIVMWTKNENKEVRSCLGKYEAASEVLELKNESITALAMAPDYVNSCYLIAVGLESGFVYLYGWNPKEWTQYLILDSSQAHHLTVRRLAFRPVFGAAGYKDQNKNILQLASCSSDTSVRIFNISVDKIKL